MRRPGLLPQRALRLLPAARRKHAQRLDRRHVSPSHQAAELHAHRRRQRNRQTLLHALRRRDERTRAHEGVGNQTGWESQVAPYQTRLPAAHLGKGLPRQQDPRRRLAAHLLHKGRRRPRLRLPPQPGRESCALLRRGSPLRHARSSDIHRLPFPLRSPLDHRFAMERHRRTAPRLHLRL